MTLGKFGPPLGVVAEVKGVHTSMWELRGVVVIDKPQKVEIQKIDSIVVLIWPGDLILREG